MKKYILIAFVCALSLIFYWTLCFPPSAPFRSVDFKITPTASGSLGTFSVIFSNTSSYNIQYFGAEKGFWLRASILTNGVWGEISFNSSNFGLDILAPHRSVTNSFKIPTGVERFKVGLPVTSLTWRGNLAWHIAEWFPGGEVKPLTGFLLQQDDRKRSQWEWSDEYHYSP